MDTLALAKELGHPVALVSAAQGKGLDVIPEFLLRAGRSASQTMAVRPVQLPVLQSCRQLPQLGHAGHVEDQVQVALQPRLWTRRLDSGAAASGS